VSLAEFSLFRINSRGGIHILSCRHVAEDYGDYYRRRSDWNSGGTHGGTYYKSPAVEAKTHFYTL